MESATTGGGKKSVHTTSQRSDARSAISTTRATSLRCAGSTKASASALVASVTTDRARPRSSKMPQSLLRVLLFVIGTWGVQLPRSGHPMNERRKVQPLGPNLRASCIPVDKSKNGLCPNVGVNNNNNDCPPSLRVQPGEFRLRRPFCN